jgi:alpha-ketoglutarate-dependent taurine dioxygenase
MKALFDHDVYYEFANSRDETLLIIKPKRNLNIFAWLEENKKLLEEYLIKFGGILLRGFDVYSVSEFNKIVQIFCPNLLDYIYRSTPRTQLGSKIYTATEYPADRRIPLHNENSYSKTWPQKIFFFSVVVATKGGETPIADSRRVYNSMDRSIRTKFEKKRILYVRNYTPGIDLSWQEVFQTDSKDTVNQYCRDNDIQQVWNAKGPALTTRQICQATLVHPVSREYVWFNQAHLFHISALDENDRIALINQLGIENMPRNTFYGDGEPIETEVLDHIRKVYDQEKIKFQWQKGDLMMLDNILTAHAREPFEGPRKIAVAMG